MKSTSVPAATEEIMAKTTPANVTAGILPVGTHAKADRASTRLPRKVRWTRTAAKRMQDALCFAVAGRRT